jgi:hypothetical protein
MSGQFDVVPVVGSITHDWNFIERVVKHFEVALTDLVAAHEAMGVGDYCGRVRLFESALIRPLEPSKFIVESVVNHSEALVIGEETDGKTVVVGSDGARALFYIINWKADLVDACDTFYDALLRLGERSDSSELFAKPFHLSRIVSGLFFEAEWNFDLAVSIVRQVVGPSTEGWAYRAALGRHFLLLDAGKTFLVDITDGMPLMIKLHYDNENSAGAREFFERWTQFALDSGMEKPTRAV